MMAPARPRLAMAVAVVIAASCGLARTAASSDLPHNFLHLLFPDLDPETVDPSPGALTPEELRAQAQTWATALEAKLSKGLGSSSSSSAEGIALSVTTPVLQVVDSLLDMRPALQRIVFNFWNATFQRYADYADQARQRYGLSPSAPLMDQLVARFRELTGTTCTPASFTPPSQEDATVTGSSWQLLLNSGNCVLSRIAQQTRRDFVVRCALPRISLAITQARYSSAYVAGANFVGSVCRRQTTLGTDSTTRIRLWDPAALADRGSAESRLLPLSDVDGDGIPNFLAKGSVLQAVRQSLRSVRSELTKSLTQTTTTVEAVSARLVESLQKSGLVAQVQQGPLASVLESERTGRRAARAQAWQDLSQLFPSLFSKSWRGGGVQAIYDKVLQHGLLSTLYRGGPAAGPFSTLFSTARRMAQSSAADDDVDGGEQEEEEGAEDGGGEGDGAALQGLFRQLTMELDRLLEERTVAQEAAAHPPTGRKVVIPRSARRPSTSTNTSRGGGASSRPERQQGGLSGVADGGERAEGGGAEPDVSASVARALDAVALEWERLARLDGGVELRH